MKPPRKRDTHDLVQIVGSDPFTLEWLRNEVGTVEPGEHVILHGTETEITAAAASRRQWAKSTLAAGVDVTFVARERSA
jgi:hypothetical protein